MTEAVGHLLNLIRIPSVSSISNRPLIEYANHCLVAAGWSTQALPYRSPAGEEKINLLAAPAGQDTEDRQQDLVFVCHTDTVPCATDWANALEPEVSEGLINGCGACDVKGFLACLLTAARGWSSAKIPIKVRIVLTADEEIGCIGASQLLVSDRLHPRRIVVGEPTSLHPARAGKGYCLAQVTVHGKEAHSAHPDCGISAIYHAARLITAIERLATDLVREQNSFFQPAYTTVNVGTVEGGTAKNVVAGKCTFQLEWRPIPDQPPRAVIDHLSAIVRNMHASNPQFDAEIRLIREQAGFETAATSSLVKSVEASSGRPAISIPFGSEASLLCELSEEIIVFGPGDMRTAHGKRECVPIDELNRAVDCLHSLMALN